MTLVRLFFLLLIVFSGVPIYAQEEITDIAWKKYSGLLDTFERELKKDRLSENQLPELIKQVTSIKTVSVQCVTEQNLLLKKLKADLSTLGESVKTEPVEVKKKRLLLGKEITDNEKQLATCKVFVLRSEETLKQLSLVQQRLLAERLLAKDSTFIKLFQDNWNKPSLRWQSSSSFIVKNSGLNVFDLKSVLVLALIFIVTFFIARFFANYLSKRVNRNLPVDAFSFHFMRAVLSVFAQYLPYLLMSLAGATYCYVVTVNASPVPFISVVAYGVPVYLLLMIIIEVFLSPRKPAVLLFSIPEDISRALAKRLKVFSLLIFLGYLLFATLLAQSLPDATYLLARGVFAIFFVLNLIWVFWILGRIPRFADTIAFRVGISLVLFSILVAEMLGYRNLSAFAMRAVLGTLILFGVLLLVQRLLCEVFEGLDQGNRSWQKKIRKAMGVHAKGNLPGLIWVRFSVGACLWLMFIVVTLRIWGLSETGMQQLHSFAIDGFTIGSLKVMPARILLSLVSLTIMLGINSWFRARLEKTWLLRTRIERGAREAMATISGYTGVAIAILIALSIAGVEFGNLAIIAGALSVGIGFGLQNIVNNFVSGLILLFERPIKTGDWIVVGGTEGYVKRISIRSTQIQTFDQADIIVPNSELISGQVTNWMLKDIKGRIRIPIGVAYGSDTGLIHDVLMDVAKQNPMVVIDGSSPEPKVLFMEFGDSALLFELRVFIHNIDKRYQATSDLNFAIDAAFRENNITIPFPQRDVHIKNVSNDSENDGPEKSE